MGDSRAYGAAERAVQAVEEQVRVVRHGLEMRLGVKTSGKHPSWFIERAADLLSKSQVGEDGNTGCQRLKGKKYRSDEVEFGEKVLSVLKRSSRTSRVMSFSPRRKSLTIEAVLVVVSFAFLHGQPQRVDERRWRQWKGSSSG